MVNQVAFQIIGYDLTITLASEARQLQLNVMEPVIAYNILHSLELLTNAVDVLRTKCIVGITANAETCRKHLEASTAVATALTPAIGYERAAELAKEVVASGKTIREVLAEQPDLSEDLIAQTADPHLLTRPTRDWHRDSRPEIDRLFAWCESSPPANQQFKKETTRKAELRSPGRQIDPYPSKPLRGPKAGEVPVEVLATGICHTDTYILWGLDSEGKFPAILGHAGASIVREVGRGVTTLRPGDHVIPLYTPECLSAKPASRSVPISARPSEPRRGSGLSRIKRHLFPAIVASILIRSFSFFGLNRTNI